MRYMTLDERYVNTHAAAAQDTGIQDDTNIWPKKQLKGFNWKKKRFSTIYTATLLSLCKQSVTEHPDNRKERPPWSEALE